MAHLYRLAVALLFFLAFPADAAYWYQVTSATAFSSAAPTSAYSTSTAAAGEFITTANMMVVNQGGCAGPKSVTLVSAPTPADGGTSTGSFNYSWTGRQNGYPTDPCVGFSASGTMTIASVQHADTNNCPAAGTSAGNWTLPGGVGSKQLCDTSVSSGDIAQPGCYASGTADFATGTGADQQSTAAMTYSGAKCSPSASGSYDGTSGDAPAPNTSAAPTKCPVGKVPGTVNGTTICVDPGSTTPTQQSGKSINTTTNPDGTTTTQDTTTTTSCDSSGCTKTTTTTTTTKDSSGNVTGTSTTSQSGTCTRGAPGCSPEGSDKESSFGGSCAAFSCDGDAIMCAVSLEQHQRNCALFDTTSEESQLYQQEKGKTGVQYQNENVNAGAAITSSNLLGVSGSCQLDKTVTVWGREVVLPFSQVCTALSYLGTLLVMVSFLLAYRIVARG